MKTIHLKSIGLAIITLISISAVSAQSNLPASQKKLYASPFTTMEKLNTIAAFNEYSRKLNWDMLNKKEKDLLTKIYNDLVEEMEKKYHQFQENQIGVSKNITPGFSKSEPIAASIERYHPAYKVK